MSIQPGNIFRVYMYRLLTFPPSIEHNRWLRSVLVAIIVGLVALTVLSIVFWVLVTHLG